MKLMQVIKATTMEKLVLEANTLSIKGGITFNFSNPVYDGKFFYVTYYIDVENMDLIKKLGQIQRGKTK